MIRECKYNFDQCVSNLINAIKSLNAQIFCEIDHRENAEKVGLEMNKAKVIFFGNPKVGTLLMQEKIEICYDLPLRIAVFEKNNKCFLEYKLPSDFTEEYQIKNVDVIKKMDEFMGNIIKNLTV
ncbi:DUF302 domain-containing protein [Acidianus manzaensis]|uniref:DUF302 domain-containing protein n=1 Tax=Acidianus manzaensis TaxID=282676 RepID=A0A1W6JWY1_9CREN|nr:DUF302 domain-containing protein [Acidianus manzaensis]ARM74778.1 hypothetical protein B6F84_01220 [Acidianus manzaensis]